MYNMEKKNIIIIGLIILLAVTLSYIGFNEIKNIKQEKWMEGYDAGSNNCVLSLMQQASNCQKIPIQAGNTTLNLVAVECLQK